MLVPPLFHAFNLSACALNLNRSILCDLQNQNRQVFDAFKNGIYRHIRLGCLRSDARPRKQIRVL